MDERSVWQTLSAINVNEHTRKKGEFTYLSWSWAWATVMESYPDSSYAFKDSTQHEDGSIEVWCTVTINGVSREMWLAVTDHRNHAIKNPSCDHVANARMRCLVKAIAMHGLGFYIYAGEGLPLEVYEPPFTDEQKTLFNSMINSDDVIGLLAFSINHRDAYINLANDAPTGDKTKLKNKINVMIAEGENQLSDMSVTINNCCLDNDEVAFDEIVADITHDKKKILTSRLSAESIKTIKEWKK